MLIIVVKHKKMNYDKLINAENLIIICYDAVKTLQSA